MALFVFTDTWWTKPYASVPWLPVQDDWTFSGLFASHVNDMGAEFFELRLVGGDTPPAAVLGLYHLPSWLDDMSFAALNVCMRFVWRVCGVYGAACVTD